MSELIAHLVGDYVLQNHWMAVNKTSRWLPAIAHVLLYGLPFLVLGASWPALAVIVGTHLLIDRFRLASYWVDFWGNGKAGWLPTWLEPYFRGTWKVALPGTAFNQALRDSGPDSLIQDLHNDIVPSLLPDDAPPFLGVWLLILVDNTMHLAINHAALAYL